MKRLLAMAVGALFAAMMFGAASAQVAGLTVTLPASSVPGTVTATVNGVSCGTATLSAAGTSTLTLNSANAVCVTAGSAIALSVNGVPITSGLTVPVGGTGALTLGAITATTPVTINVTGTGDASGTLNVLVNGVPCGSIELDGDDAIVLPAACSIPGQTITFTGAGGAALSSTLTVPAAGGTLELAGLLASDPITVTFPAGTGTVDVFVNGDACGSVTLIAGTVSTLSLPATCAVVGGTLTFVNDAGAQLSTTATVPAAGGVVTVSNLQVNPLRILLGNAPAGTITAMVNGQVCGTGTVSSTAPGVIVLADACAVAGATITFVTGDGVALDTTLTVPADLNVVLNLDDFTTQTPTIIQLPTGTGEVDILVDGVVCATVDLSATTTVTAILGATCVVPSAPVTFMVNGTLSSTAVLIPAAGSGTVVVDSLVVTQAPPPTVPGPADTGNAGLVPGSSMPQTLLGLAMLVAVLGSGFALRKVGVRD